MRVILDTNILISALISDGPPETLYRAWRSGRLDLISCEEQLEEFRRVTRYPSLRSYINRNEAGAMLNEIRQLATVIANVPWRSFEADSADGYLIALAELSKAHYLVTGDKAHLLGLGKVGGTKIVTVRRMVQVLARR